MSEDAGFEGDATIEEMLSKETEIDKALGPNLHKDATMAWYENLKDGKGEPRAITSYTANHFLIGFALSEKEFGEIEERISDLLLEDGVFKASSRAHSVKIIFSDIEDTIREEFDVLLNKQGIPRWWSKFAITGWVRYTAQWMRKAGDRVDDKRQGKKMKVLRGGVKSFKAEMGEEEKVVAKGVKRKTMPRASAAPKSYLEDDTEYDDVTADVDSQSPVKKARFAPFAIQMGDDEEDDNEECVASPALSPAEEFKSTTSSGYVPIPEAQSEDDSSTYHAPTPPKKRAYKRRKPAEVIVKEDNAEQIISPTSPPPSERKPTALDPILTQPSTSLIQERFGSPNHISTNPQPPKNTRAIPKSRAALRTKKASRKRAPHEIEPATSTPLLKNSQLLITVRHKPHLLDSISLLDILSPDSLATLHTSPDLNPQNLVYQRLIDLLMQAGMMSPTGDELKWVINEGGRDIDMPVKNDRQLCNAVLF